MRTLVSAVVLIAAALLFPLGNSVVAVRQQPRYMAFCTDGDGDLTGWLTSRDEALMAGRDHEKNTRGHRWEIVTEGNDRNRPAERCAATSTGKREGVIQVENVCSECRIFRVSRRAGNEAAREKDITFQPNASRYFRLMDGAQLTIRRETGCPGQ